VVSTLHAGEKYPLFQQRLPKVYTDREQVRSPVKKQLHTRAQRTDAPLRRRPSEPDGATTSSSTAWTKPATDERSSAYHERGSRTLGRTKSNGYSTVKR
jgi:hypothetical protein